MKKIFGASVDLFDLDAPSTSHRVMLTPIGQVYTENEDSEFTSSEFSISEQQAMDMLVAFDRVKRDLLIDMNHDSVLKPDEEAIAVGWVKQGSMSVEPVEGGIFEQAIFADVSWVGDKKAAVDKGEFRYLSPVFSMSEDNLPTEILSASLTNNPAIRGIAPLTVLNRTVLTAPLEDSEMDELLKELRVFLSLDEDADEAVILNSLKDFKPETDASDAEAEKLQGVLGEIGKALGIEDVADVSAFTKAISGLKMDPDKIDKSEFLSLRSELDQAQAKLKDLEWNEIVANSTSKIPPAKISIYKKNWEQDPEQFAFWLGEMPELVSDDVNADLQTPVEKTRESVIANARKSFGAAPVKSQSFTNERNWISISLSDEGMKRLSEKEAETLGLGG